MQLNTLRTLALSLSLLLSSCSNPPQKHSIIEKNNLLPTGFYPISNRFTDFERTLPLEGGYKYFLVPRPIVTAADIKKATAEYEQGGKKNILKLQFAEEGTKALAAFTEQKGKSIGLIVDDELLLVATIQGTITTGQIEIGSLTSEEIANTINSINHSKKK